MNIGIIVSEAAEPGLSYIRIWLWKHQTNNNHRQEALSIMAISTKHIVYAQVTLILHRRLYQRFA